VSKILEKIVRDSLMEHLRVNNLLSDKQFGFLEGRSAKIQMIRVMDDWTKCVDQNMAVHIIYLDFMKAFDKVSHEYLIHKLENFGTHQKILYWIQDFLNGRSQSVTYNNHIIFNSSSKWSPTGVSHRTGFICVIYKRSS